MMNTEKIKKLNACDDQAWKDCVRGDWMLWLLGKVSDPVESQSRKDLVIDIARKYFPASIHDKDRADAAIMSAIETARGE